MNETPENVSRRLDLLTDLDARKAERLEELERRLELAERRIAWLTDALNLTVEALRLKRVVDIGNVEPYPDGNDR